MVEHARFTIDVDVRSAFTACYLRTAGEECAFIEAHTAHALPKLLGSLEAHGRTVNDVRWIIVTHAHLDHAAGASALLAACPRATLVAHPRAARHLIDPDKLIQSATAVYGADRFRKLYGRVDPIPRERVRVLEDGDSVPLADATLRAFHTAGHANHHLVVHDPATETVYTGDAFGLVYPALQARGRFALPSTSPTNFDAALARESIARVLSLGTRLVSLTHYDTYEDAPIIAAQVVRFLDRAEEWVDEAAAGDETVEKMTRGLATAWHMAIAEEAPRFGEAEREWLALDVDLNAQGLAFVADQKRTRRREKTA